MRATVWEARLQALPLSGQERTHTLLPQPVKAGVRKEGRAVESAAEVPWA